MWSTQFWVLQKSLILKKYQFTIFFTHIATFAGSKMYVFLALWKIHNSSKQNSYSDQQTKCPKIWKRKKWCVLSVAILLSQPVEEFYEKSIGRQYNAFAYRKPFPNLSLRIQLAESLLALAARDGFFSACSTCVFFGLAKAHVETRKEGRKWGESKGAGYFSPLPLPGVSLRIAVAGE